MFNPLIISVVRGNTSVFASFHCPNRCNLNAVQPSPIVAIYLQYIRTIQLKKNSEEIFLPFHSIQFNSNQIKSILLSSLPFCSIQFYSTLFSSLLLSSLLYSSFLFHAILFYSILFTSIQFCFILILNKNIKTCICSIINV